MPAEALLRPIAHHVLTTDEKNRLKNLEGQIEAAVEMIKSIGDALLEIRDSRLYRQEFSTFDQYCLARWSISRPRAYQLIDMSKLAGQIGARIRYTSITEAHVRELKRVGPDDQAEIWEKTKQRFETDRPSMRQLQEIINEHTGKTETNSGNVLLSSDSVEWYTPEEYTNAARATMNDIELDPASNPIANNWIRARRYFTEQDDGLSLPWESCAVWLNPPYGTTDTGESNQEKWTRRLISEFECGNVTQACCLVNSATGNQWFQPLWSFPICFVSSRIKFLDRNCEKQAQPTHSNVVVYIGPNKAAFVHNFRQFGTIVLPKGGSLGVVA